MPYYSGRGDYYSGRGDYYRGRGDPGLFDVLGGAVKGFLGGGPAGAILGAARATVPAKPALQLPGPFMPGVGIQARGPLGTGVAIGRFTGGTAVTTATMPAGHTCPVGYHLSKRTGKCVKNRHMNPTNARALRRAIRREHAFVALAKRTLRGTGITVKRAASFARSRTRRGCGCK